MEPGPYCRRGKQMWYVISIDTTAVSSEASVCSVLTRRMVGEGGARVEGARSGDAISQQPGGS